MTVNLSDELVYKILEISREYSQELDRQIGLSLTRTPAELARKRRRQELQEHADEVYETFLELADFSQEGE